MTKKRWKKVVPTNMSEAIRLCLDYATHKHNRNVKRVADLNGISEWVIYRWMSEGSIPSKRVAPFELACGCHFVTEYLAGTAQKLLVDIPSGREMDESDLMALQTQLNGAVNQLHRYYNDDAEAAEARTATTDAMTALAGQRANLAEVDTPELGLFAGDDNE